MLHHLETMGNHCLLGICRGTIIPGFLNGGAGFRPSTVGRLAQRGSPPRGLEVLEVICEFGSAHPAMTGAGRWSSYGPRPLDDGGL